MRIYAIFGLLLLCAHLSAQINGKISDENGEALPYANVYVQNTSSGTASNGEGDYFLNLKPGNYSLIFRYVGYQSEKREITVGTEPITLDVQLSEQTLDLKTITINANDEDPAYAIIRKAIAKRKYYKDIVPEYSCKTYVKGIMRFIDAPEKIMGQEIGDLEGTLDSNRRGIFYLSESESNLYYQSPNFKEVMTSSRVSGNDNGFSFNRAVYTNASFYENQIDLNRRAISPIASSAMTYYRYKLLGTFFDNYGNLINKIQVIPKNNEAPAFGGHIYITEDLWNIQGANLFITGIALNQPVLDTLRFVQTFVPMRAPDVWMPISQSLNFQFSVLGFKGAGNFNSHFKDYELEPDFDKKFFNLETFKVSDSANTKDAEYWKAVRRIPLTLEEKKDYIRKDSLQVLRESKPFRDSMDKVGNKFKLTDVLFGYSYDKSYNRMSIDVQSPLNAVGFNAVQGWHPYMNITYRKYYNEESTRWMRANAELSYGFADEQFRYKADFAYRFNSVNYSRIDISGGRTIEQFNRAEPISPMVNLVYSLLAKKNYAKLYERRFGRVGYQREIINGIYAVGALTYADRRGLVNNTNYSLANKDSLYYPNIPGLDERPAEMAAQPAFNQNKALIFDLYVRLRINQRYATYPDRKRIYGSSIPDILIRYRKGIAAFDSDVNYDRLAVSLEEDYSIGLGGTISLFAEGGAFLNKNPQLAFMDRYHFEGNQTLIGNPDQYDQRFLAMRYYDYSSNDSYFQFHAEHNFEGFIFDRLPLLRKLGWSLAAGAAYASSEQGDYYEAHIGIDNIGFGVFRLFRFDLVAPFPNSNFDKIMPVIGIKL